jgi:hypothetical protein
VVRLGTGLLATIAGLVLGLLIASANSTYDTQSGQVRRLTADIILLDTFLGQYGPEAPCPRAHAAGHTSIGRKHLAYTWLRMLTAGAIPGHRGG